MEIYRGFENALKAIENKIISSSQTPFVIGIAGTSASGKTYLSTLLKELLEKRGKKVLIINSDNFYKPNTPEFLKFYDTFDHQETIDLKELRELIKEIIERKEGEFSLPLYSFEKATRIGYERIKVEGVDVVIVEGIYVLNVLHDVAHLSIYVKSHSLIEEVLRRMVRDSEGERLNLDVERVFRLLVGAYLMFDLFGKDQESKANVIVVNDYALLNHANTLKKGRIISVEKLEREIKESSNAIWFSYEDDEGVKMIIKDEINKRLKVYIQSQGKVVMYEIKEEGMFIPLHTLARVMGLKMYKIKERN